MAEMREIAGAAARPLGLVPTMGAVHAGHVALMERVRLENSTVVTSLFVNPIQFDDSYDFESYTRDIERDLAEFESSGTDFAFTPAVGEVYPPGFSTSIRVGKVAERLEGAFRPGHFTGVATVVCKLLAAIRPDCVYFGQKDAQQCAVVRRLNADLDLGAKIIVVPTVRDPDGLALSSRNARLSDSERASALVLYKALQLAEKLWVGGVRDAEHIRSRMRRLIDGQAGVCPEYISVADPDTFEEIDHIEGPVVVSLAACVGGTRLIDNVVLEQR